MPAIVEAPTLIVKIDVVSPLAGGVIELALRVVVTPVGTPETERSMISLKPFIEVTVMVELAEPSSAIVTEAGDAEMEKSGAAVTVRLIATL